MTGETNLITSGRANVAAAPSMKLRDNITIFPCLFLDSLVPSYINPKIKNMISNKVILISMNLANTPPGLEEERILCGFVNPFIESLTTSSPAMPCTPERILF
jgi:hypothetical protein